jgi:hypothetical protein
MAITIYYVVKCQEESFRGFISYPVDNDRQKIRTSQGEIESGR